MPFELDFLKSFRAVGERKAECSYHVWIAPSEKR